MTNTLETLIGQLTELANTQVTFNLNMQRNLTALMATIVALLATLREQNPQLCQRLEQHLEAQEKVLSTLPDLDSSEQIRYFLKILQYQGPPSEEEHPMPPWFRGIVPGGRRDPDQDS